MSVDFFKQECLTITNEKKFGICDKGDSSPAFMQTEKQEEWVAKVFNDSAIKLELRAIDSCLKILRPDGNQEKSCDCMLTYSENIVFIELKDERHGWMSDGIKQLEETISRFSQDYDIKQYKHRRAFVANRRHPKFHTIEDETKIRFRDKHKVRLSVQAEIVIK